MGAKPFAKGNEEEESTRINQSNNQHVARPVVPATQLFSTQYTCWVTENGEQNTRTVRFESPPAPLQLLKLSHDVNVEQAEAASSRGASSDRVAHAFTPAD